MRYFTDLLRSQKTFFFQYNTNYHSRRLQPVCEDDVWVHGTHVKMIDDRVLQSEIERIDEPNSKC
jgi:hypothetical protein